MLLEEEQRRQVDIVCDKLDIDPSVYTFICPLNSEHRVESLGQGITVFWPWGLKSRLEKKEENGS